MKLKKKIDDASTYLLILMMLVTALVIKAATLYHELQVRR